MVVVKIFENEKFQNTGWNPKKVEVDIPEGTWGKAVLYFSAESHGDPYDRCYSVACQGVELHRGITGFGGRIDSQEDVTQYLRLFKGRVTFQVFLTTYLGYWLVTVKLELTPGTPPSPLPKPIPILLWQHIESSEPVTKTVSIDSKGGKLVLHGTGHSYEEGSEKWAVVKADDVEVMRTLIRRWSPGQGRVPPYYKDLDKLTCSRISLTVEGATKYWKISLAYLDYAPTPPIPWEWIIIGVLATIGIIGTVYLVSESLKSPPKPPPRRLI